jgi:hypothetical protein
MTRTLVVAALIAMASSAQADEPLAQWNFNSVPSDGSTSTGTTMPVIGSGTAALVGGTTATFASGDASGGSSDPSSGDDSGWNVTTFAAQGSGDKSRGVQFNVSTAGYRDIVVTWDQRHSNTAARDVLFQYTTDGSTWIDAGSFAATAGDAWFNGRTVDLSTVAAVEDNAEFGFRVVATFAPGTSSYAASTLGSTYGTAGTWRFDMVTVSAMPIPEPGTYALMAAGLLAVGFFARRRVG